jgi:hypothetical protein
MRRAWWLVAAPVALAAISPAGAADSQAGAFWVVADVHGAVLALVGGQWRALRRGDRIGSGIAVRTLQTGSVRLRRGTEEIGLAADTVVRPTVIGGRSTVEQYTGVVRLVEPDGTASQAATPADGGMGGGSAASGAVVPPAALYVRGGEAHLSVGGRPVLLRAGEGYAPHGNWQAPVIPESAGARVSTVIPPAVPDAPATGNATDSGSAAAGDPANTGHDFGTGGMPGNGEASGSGNAGNAGRNGNSWKGRH